jgi:hypothetical protein
VPSDATLVPLMVAFMRKLSTAGVWYVGLPAIWHLASLALFVVGFVFAILADDFHSITP